MERRLVDSISENQVRAHLALILAAPDFAKAKQLRVLLEFLVIQTLSGLSSQINQTTIALAVFNRDESFDSALDNLVRVEVGRLRKRLDLFYQEDGWLHDIRINIPKGTYVPEFLPQAAGKAAIGSTLAGHRITALRAHSPDGLLFHALSPRTLRDVLLWLSNPLKDAQSVLESARLTAMVTHPRICPLQDVGLVANRVYMVFAFPSEELLSERLKKGPLHETKAVALLRNLSEAVGSLHAAGLVSGTLRPDYVILSEGAEEVATVLLPATDPETCADDTGRSPEQRNGHPADQRSDVWAIGSMIDASLPTQEPVSTTLRELTGRCLQVDPAQRFASAQELSVALSKASQPITKPPMRLTPRFHPWVRMLILLLAIAASLGAGYIWNRSRHAAGVYEIEGRPSATVVRGLGTTIPVSGLGSNTRTNNPEAFRVWSQAHESVLDYLNNLYLKPKIEVERDLQRALELDPSYPDPMIDLGLVNWMAAFPPTPQQPQEIARAENWFRMALEKAPQDALATASLGRLTFFRGERLSAVRCIQEAARTSKDDPYVLFALADAYTGMGYWESALAEFGALIKADPLLNVALDHEALILTMLGRHEEAIRATEALPVNSPRRINILIDIHLKMGHVSEAKNLQEHLKRLGSILPDPVTVARVAAARGDLETANRLADHFTPGVRITDGLLFLCAELGDESRLLATMPNHPLAYNYRWMIGQPGLKRFQQSPLFQERLREQYQAWQDGLTKLSSSLPVRPPDLPDPDEYLRNADIRPR